jgi:fermentation-respiration switch protein FrsA (DUF1100 family)
MARRVHTSWSMLVIAASCALLFTGCVDRLFYYPTDRVYDTPASCGFSYDEVVFASGDGTRLAGWFIPAVGEAVGTVVHFHGNAQNMTSHFSYVSWLPLRGFNLFLFDYRGYGSSGGRPQREGIHEDCIAALAYVKNRPHIDPNRVVILGQSLGGAHAVSVMQEEIAYTVRAVAVDSSFFSYRLIVQDKIARIPVLTFLHRPLSRLIIDDRLSPHLVIGSISPVPILIIHGTDDRVVPYHHGKMLFDAAEEPKELVTVVGGSHTDAFVRPESTYRDILVRFFMSAL